VRDPGGGDRTQDDGRIYYGNPPGARPAAGPRRTNTDTTDMPYHFRPPRGTRGRGDDHPAVHHTRIDVHQCLPWPRRFARFAAACRPRAGAGRWAGEMSVEARATARAASDGSGRPLARLRPV